MNASQKLGHLEKSASLTGGMQAYRAVGRMVPRLTQRANNTPNALASKYKAGWGELDVVRSGQSSGSLKSWMRALKDDAMDATGTARHSPERGFLAETIRELRSSGFQHPMDKTTVFRTGATKAPTPVSGLQPPSAAEQLMQRARSDAQWINTRTPNPGFDNQIAPMRAMGLL